MKSLVTCNVALSMSAFPLNLLRGSNSFSVLRPGGSLPRAWSGPCRPAADLFRAAVLAVTTRYATGTYSRDATELERTNADATNASTYATDTTNSYATAQTLTYATDTNATVTNATTTNATGTNPTGTNSNATAPTRDATLLKTLTTQRTRLVTQLTEKDRDRYATLAGGGEPLAHTPNKIGASGSLKGVDNVFETLSAVFPTVRNRTRKTTFSLEDDAILRGGNATRLD